MILEKIEVAQGHQRKKVSCRAELLHNSVKKILVDQEAGTTIERRTCSRCHRHLSDRLISRVVSTDEWLGVWPVRATI